MADIIVDGKTRVAFVPTIANIAAPTTTELDAGDLIHDLLVPTGLAGFEGTTAEVDNTALGSTFDTRLPGRTSFSGTSLTLKKQSGTDAVYDLLNTKGTSGYVVIRDGIDADTAWTASDVVEVFPVRTGQRVTMGRGEANSVLRYMVPTPIESEPALDATVAAGA